MRSYIILISFLFITGLQGQNIPRPNIALPYGMSVNSYTGSLLYQRSDMVVKGRGMSTVIGFTYSTANDTANIGYGKGWTFNYHTLYRIQTDSFIVVHPDGKTDIFKIVNGKYIAPVGIFDSLRVQSGTYILRKKNGMEYFFENSIHKKLTKIIDANGNAIVLTYGGNYPVQITNASGRNVTLTWNNGFLTSVSDATVSPARTVLLAYDTESRLISVTNPLGQQTQFSYTGTYLSQMLDAKNNPVKITYGSDNTVREVNTCVNSYQFRFQTDYGKSFFIRKSSSQDLITVYEFDSTGRHIGLQNPLGNKLTMKYDSQNNLIETTDFNSNVFKMVYDSKGNLLSATDAVGKTTAYTYEPIFNNLTSYQDKKGSQTAFLYDSKGNLTTVNHPLSISQSFGYNAVGELTGVTDGKNHTTAYNYDAQGNLSSVNLPIGTLSMTYDASGNLLTSTDANNTVTTYAYDKLSRLISITDALGNITRYEYDAAGNIAKIINPKKRERLFSYDALNRLTMVKYGVEQANYVYDEEGNLTTITNPRGAKIRFTYDLANRLTEQVDPLGYKTTFTYDNNGNLLTKTNPNGTVITYQYDKRNKLISRAYGSEKDIYEYDDNGNMVAAINGAAAYMMEYDALSRLTKVNNTTWDKKVTYQYDAAGNRTLMVDPNNGQHQYTYDNNNRLSTLTDPLSNVYSFTYDAGGRTTRKTFPNNAYSTYNYNNAGHLTAIDNYNAANVVQSFSHYTTDSLGFRKTMTDNTGTHNYTYDTNDRLQKVIYPSGKVVEYAFDAFGNVTQKTEDGVVVPYAYNAFDQLTTGAGAQYQFDKNGNQIARIGGTQPTMNYQFDELNRFKGGQFTSGKRVEYAYDPFGNIIQRRDTANTIEKYFFDGQNLLAELDGSNAVNTTYTSTLALDGWLGKIVNGNQERYFIQDGLGSVMNIMDNAGQVTNAYRYDVYGNILSVTGAEGNNVLFTGRLWDNQLAFYNQRARFADPAVGRFINVDNFDGFAIIPISLNKYLSVNSNPVNYIDPKGTFIPLLAIVPIASAVFVNALAGASLNLAGQFLWNGGDPFNGSFSERVNQIDISDVGISAGLGGIGGGIFAAVFKTSALKAFRAGNLTLPMVAAYSAISLSKLGIGSPLKDIFDWNPWEDFSLPQHDPNSPESCGWDNPAGDYSPAECPNPEYPNDPNSPPGSQKPPCLPGPGNGGSGGDSLSCPIIPPVDPNEIRAPNGYDTLRWVSGKDRMPYTILFENDPELGALAPAQRVIVRHPLPDKINPNSFRLGDFGFGRFTFKVPTNRTSYTTRLNLKDSIGLFVDVTAGLDIQKNEAFWILESIDPKTGLASTLAATQGFLEVNDSTKGNGEGFVNFSVQPKSTVQTLDTVIAQATIFFDDEESVVTNIERNLIDAGKPTSRVAVLPFTYKDSVQLRFSGRDDTKGVGVGSYSLYVSKNSEPFYLQEANITTGATLFKGEQGASYRFYSLAKDHVGNEENPKDTVDITTKSFDKLVQVNAKVFLQGSYVSSVSLMHDSLRSKGLIPFKEPYSGLAGFTHVGGGNETTTDSVLLVTGNNAIVDWLFLELRNSANPAQVIATRAALLQRDGDIVDVDGVSSIYFSAPEDQSYYLTIRHRNHFGVQTGIAKLFPSKQAVNIDLRTLPTEGYYVYNTDNTAQKLISGKYTMWAGNGKSDFLLKYNGSNNDRNIILSAVGLNSPNQIIAGYLIADYNMDGLVKYNGSNNDRNVLLGNLGLTNPNNVLYEQIAR